MLLEVGVMHTAVRVPLNANAGYHQHEAEVAALLLGLGRCPQLKTGPE